MDSCKGRNAIEALATRFPQLYVAPADDAEEAYKRAATRGIAPEGANLDHFVTSDEDELREVQTPAGPVEVVFLKERADFECFLRIMGHRARLDSIAPTVGAITYLGLADWGKVRAEYARFVAEGGEDWSAEFARLAKEPGRLRTQIVAISEGPYSNVAADEVGYAESEWLRLSREIRLHHECGHVVCRRLMPGDVLPVWDEVTADAVGLMGALGRYDARLAARFLGVSEAGQGEGRLTEYLDEGQLARVHEVAREVYAAVEQLGEAIGEAEAAHPFETLLDLKRAPLLAY